MEASNVKEKRTGGFTIFNQILLTMLIIAIIPLGGLWYISINKAKEDWTANIFHSLERNTVTLADRVDDWTIMNLRLLSQNSKTPAIVSMEAEKQNPVLKSMTDIYEWVYLAFTIRPDGDNVGRSDGKTPKYYGDRAYFKQVMGGRDVGQQVLMGKTSGKPAFILSKPVMSENMKTAGVLAIAMTLEDLSATVTNTKIGDSGFAILVDERNRLIAHGKGEVANELQDMSSNTILAFPHKITKDNFIFEDNGKKIVAFKYKTEYGWTLIVQQDFAEAYAAAEIARINALTLLGITLVVVLIVAYLLARRLSNPILRLTDIADEISRGNLGAEIKEKSRSDEIGALARAIDRMGVSLQMAFDRLRKKR